MINSLNANRVVFSQVVNYSNPTGDPVSFEEELCRIIRDIYKGSIYCGEGICWNYQSLIKCKNGINYFLYILNFKK